MRPQVGQFNFSIAVDRSNTRKDGVQSLGTKRDLCEVIAVERREGHAFLYTPDGDGRGRVRAIPHMLEDDAKAAHEALIDLVAEGKDELMEEFFAVGTIPKNHLISALHEAIRETGSFLFPM
jgi:hypothetical protein